MGFFFLFCFLFFNLYNARIVTRSTVGTHFVRSFMVPRNCQLIVRTLLAYTVALPGPQLNSPPIFTLLCYVGHPQASRTLLEGSQTCVCVVFVPVLCCLECWWPVCTAFILFFYSPLKAKSTCSVLSLQSTLHVPASLLVPRYPLNLSRGHLESSLAFFLVGISRDGRHIFSDS